MACVKVVRRPNLGYNARSVNQKLTVRKATLAALVLFAVLALVLTYPLFLHLAGAVEDRQDALLNVWITAWDGHQFLSDPLHLFDANIFYPYPRTLAYSELLLGNGLLALPITAAGGNPVLGYHVVLLLSFVLTGFGTYLLVLELTQSPGAGMVAGIIFAFCSYRLTNLAQAQLLTTQWLPFALLAWRQLLRRGRPRHLAAFVLFFCLQALSSFYYGILLALALFGFWLLDAGSWLRSRLARHSVLAPFARPFSPRVLIATGCAVLLLLPFALPYFQVQHELGFERSLADAEPFSASLRQFLMVPPGSVLYGHLLPNDAAPIAGGYPVDALFPGLVALALGAWGLVKGRGRTRWSYLCLLLAAGCLSLGPRLYLSPGRPAGLGVALPYAWLYAIVPGFKAMRAPVRFDALAMLALAVLAGYGVATWTQARSRHGGLLALCCMLLVAAESLVWPAAHAEPVPVGGAVPPVYHWLAARGAGPLLELPMAFTQGGPQLDYQYLSTYHWQPTPDGYSGFIPPKHGQVVYEMERFPSERSVSLLQALGVRNVVIHADRYAGSPGRWSAIQSALDATADLTLVESFAADRVVEVLPRTFPVDELELSAYVPPRAVTGAPYTAYLLVVNRGTRSYAIPPTAEIQATATWTGAGGSSSTQASADIPLVTSPDGGAAVIPLVLTAPEAAGSYRLLFGEQKGPLGEWQAAGDVTVGTAAELGAVQFPVAAQLVAWDAPSTVQPGQELPVSLTWRALGKIDAYYSIYVKLIDAQGNSIAAWDGQPQAGNAPTLLWVPGEEIDDVVRLTVPAGAPPGEYTLEVGMYRAQDLARCLTLNRDGIPIDRVTLGVVRIGP